MFIVFANKLAGMWTKLLGVVREDFDMMDRVLDRFCVCQILKKNGSALGQYVGYSLTSGKPVIQLGVRFGVTYILNSVYQNV